MATVHTPAHTVTAPLMNGLAPPSTPLNSPRTSFYSRSSGGCTIKLSLRDIAEMFLARGFPFTYEAIRDWEERFAPLITDQLRMKRHGQAGKSWSVDETYLKVHGKWCYVYRVIDHDGNLVDSVLSEKRNMEAAQRFFKQAVAVIGHVPEQVITDGHISYPRAICETMGSNILHQKNKYLNNKLEQDHLGIHTALLSDARIWDI